MLPSRHREVQQTVLHCHLGVVQALALPLMQGLMLFYFLSLSLIKVQALSSASKFEAEIKAEQDERKREEEERKHRRAAFRELKSAFTQ